MSCQPGSSLRQHQPRFPLHQSGKKASLLFVRFPFICTTKTNDTQGLLLNRLQLQSKKIERKNSAKVLNFISKTIIFEEIKQLIELHLCPRICHFFPLMTSKHFCDNRLKIKRSTCKRKYTNFHKH